MTPVHGQAFRTPATPFLGYQSSLFTLAVDLQPCYKDYPSRALDSIIQARSYLDLACHQTAELLLENCDRMPDIKHGLSKRFSDLKDFAQTLNLRVYPTEEDIWQPPCSPPSGG
jgi:hypothetical protein